MLVAACLVLIAATLIMQVLEFRATIGAGSQAAHGAPSTQTQGVSYPALVCYVRPYVVNRVQASPFITLASNSQTQVDTSPALVRSGQSSLQSSATAGTVQAVFRTGQAVSPVGALYCTAPYALHNWTTDQHAAITLARQPARSALAAPLTTSNSLRVQTPVWPGWATPTSA